MDDDTTTQRGTAAGYVLSVVGFVVGGAAGLTLGNLLAGAVADGDLGDLGTGLALMLLLGLAGVALGTWTALLAGRQPSSARTAVLVVPISLAFLVVLPAALAALPDHEWVWWVAAWAMAIIVPLAIPLIARRLAVGREP